MTTLTLHSAADAAPADVRSAPPVRCDVVDALAALEPHAGAWGQLAPAGVGLTPTLDWCRAWWESRVDPGELRVVVAWAEDTLVGVVPVVIEPVRLGPVRLRVARLLGCEHAAAGFDPAIRDDVVTQVADHLLHRLIRTERCQAVLLRGLRCDSPRARGLMGRVHARTDLVRVTAETDSGLVAELAALPESDPTAEGAVEVIEARPDVTAALPPMVRQLDRVEPRSSSEIAAWLRAIVRHVGDDAGPRLLQWRVDDRIRTRWLVAERGSDAMIVAEAGDPAGHGPLLATLAAAGVNRVTLGPASRWRDGTLPIVERPRVSLLAVDRTRLHRPDTRCFLALQRWLDAGGPALDRSCMLLPALAERLQRSRMRLGLRNAA